MQKAISVVLIGTVVCGIVWYGYQKLHEVPIAALESIVPEDAFGYVSAYNVASKIHDFQSAPFFQRIASYVPAEAFNAQVKKMSAQMPFLSEVAQQDTALAVFSLGNPALGPGAGSGDFICLTRIDSRKQGQIKKKVLDAYLVLTGLAKPSQSRYKGIAITSYQLSGMTIGCAFLSDVLIVGNNLAIIQKCVDIYLDKNHSGSLRDNLIFKKCSAKVKKDALLWGCWNTQRYEQTIGQVIERLPSDPRRPGEAQFLKELRKTKLFTNFFEVTEGYGFYLDYDEFGQGLIVKSYHVYNKAKDAENMLGVLAPQTTIKPDTLRLVPRTVMACYGGSREPAALWQLVTKFLFSLEGVMKEGMKRDPRYAAFSGQIDAMNVRAVLGSIEAFLGVNIEKDIIAQLGNNYGIVCTGLQKAAVMQGPSFPVPEVYGFWELKDPAKMQDTMARITQRVIINVNQILQVQEKMRKRRESESKAAAVAPQTDLSSGMATSVPAESQEPTQYVKVETEEYQGTNIYSIAVKDFPVSSIKVNYCFLGRYMILSLSPDLTKRIISLSQDTRGSTNINSTLESMQHALSPNYFDLMVFNVSKALKDIRASGILSLAQMPTPPGSPKAPAKEDIEAFLNLLGAVKVVAYTSRTLDAETTEASVYAEIEGIHK